MIKKNCQNCNKEFKVYPSLNRIKFCSYKCYWKSIKGTHPKTEFKKGCSSWVKGKHIKINNALEVWRKNGGTLSEEQKRKKYEKISIKLTGRKLSSEHILKISGENASNWQGGASSKNYLLRHSEKFRNWRRLVFKRDNYICWICEIRGLKLHPHHLKSWQKYPELRFDINNGITLCDFCHKVYTNFGSNYQLNGLAAGKISLTDR